jgi:alpha-N-arabinofuranosidase
MKDVIKTNYNLQDGIWTALALMTFQKMSDLCPMANWAQLINTIGTIQTDPDGLLLTPVYLAFKLFREHMDNNFLEGVKVECETFNTAKFGRIPKMENVPYIHCAANIDDNGKNLSIMIINKHFTEILKTALEIKGFIPEEKGIKVELTSESPFDYNTVENRKKIQIKEKEIKNLKPTMTIELNPCSVTILKLTKA